ncbi:MAG TPA: Rieske 2Fe-2S domain-containing protein [Bryobacteraceae bacterium]|jgi:nitrite reductase/ring-hydroxylating ferredoxin subunit
MPLVKVTTLTELPPGTLSEVQVAGAPYAVCNVDGAIHCVDGTCPHEGGPLGEGTLEGNNITCPWHSFAFDCRTGANDMDEDLRVRSYPVVIQDGNILIDLP